MPSLDASVQLDIADAQSQVDALASFTQSSLTDATTAFATQFQSSVADIAAQLAALTDGLNSGISSAADALETDMSKGIASATDQVATFDAGLASAAVTAGSIGDALDTSIGGNADDALQALNDELQQVNDSAQQTGDSVGSVVNPVDSLKAATGLAAGNVTGLTESLLGIGGKTSVVVGGIAAVAGGTYELANAGITAASAEERFNSTLGDQAKAFERLHVGDLTANLFELTAKMGSTTAATQDAAATTIQFAQNAGASKDQATRFGQELFALAARAVALKPSLGDVATVATSMDVGLGRAKSAAQQFGIAVSQADINARALSDTGKTSATDLTAYEKSVAGAEIAVERYGSTLKNTIQTGSQNAAIQQRALTAEIKNTFEELGKPLVVPLLDAIRASIPIVKTFGEALAVLSQVLVVVGPVLEAIGPAVTPAIIAFGAFYTASVIIPAVLGLVEAAVGTLALGFPALASSAATAGAAIETTTAGIESAAGPIGIVVALVGIAVAAFGLFSSSAHDAGNDVNTFANQLAKLGNSDALAKFRDRVETSAFTTNELSESLRVFGKVANDNVGVAQRLLDAMRANGESTWQYQGILDKAIAKQERHKKAMDDAAVTAEALTQGLSRAEAATLSGAAANEKSQQSLDKEVKSLNAVNDALLAQYDAAYASVKATDAARDAVDKINTAYDDAIKQGKSVADANDAVRRATDDAGEALLKAGAAAEKAGEQQSTSVDPIQRAHDGYVAQVDALHHLEDTLAPDSPLRAFLDTFIGNLKDPALNSPHVTEIQTPGLSDANAQLAVLLDQLSNIPTDVGIAAFVTGGAGSPGRMAGGPVEAGGTYLVGERGPELLTLGGVGGYVTPNHMILGAQGSASSGTNVTVGNISVTVTAPPGTNDPNAFGAAAGAAAAREIRAIVGAL